MSYTYIPGQCLNNALQSCVDAKTALNQAVNTTPKTKDYSIVSTPQASNSSPLRSDLKNLSTLLHQPRLAASEILIARTLIESYIPAGNRAKYSLALQGKVNYQNQRNSAVKGYSMWKGTYGKWVNVGNEMCNLSALSMAMLYQGITMDDLAAKLRGLGFEGKMAAQYDDRLEQIRHQMAVNLADGKKLKVTSLRRDSNATLRVLAESFGLNVEIKYPGKQDYDWYKENVLSELAAGKSVIMSYNGHIVRVQGVTEAGLVVDDPFGQVQIKKGSAIEIPWDKRANSKDNTRITGEDHVLPWAQVEEHGMYWMQVIER